MNAFERRLRNKLQRDYVLDLATRTRSVVCPHCGAEEGANCRGLYGQAIAGCHLARKDAAKRAGKLHGRRAATRSA